MSFKLSVIDECGHSNFYQFGRCLYKYTGCGPWVVAVLLDGTEVYYKSAEGDALSMDTVVDYVKVGSIVEGSDVEIGPYEVHDPAEFWDTVTTVDEEASFYWDRDNTQLFEIERDGYTTVYVRNRWGDIEWENGFPFWIRRVWRDEIIEITNDPEESEEWTVGPYTLRLIDQGSIAY